ncbi:unnamed protein product [marine sediment metagenome]|uniref:Uncharacterized protein n=1 Tax=marine sediment metagenome TaxID=412755 RepID=X1I534_9ZZZZ
MPEVEAEKMSEVGYHQRSNEFFVMSTHGLPRKKHPIQSW